MDDKCCWPGCHNESGITLAGKPLCDKHWDKAASESAATRKRAYAKLKIPFDETIVGRVPSFDESSYLCCFPGCTDCVSMVVNDKPFCSDHWRQEKQVEFDGVWRNKYTDAPRPPKPKSTPAPKPEQKPKPEPEPEEDSELMSLQERLLAGDFDKYE